MTPVTWSLSGADSAVFQMNDNTLEFESVPNYEQPLDNDSDDSDDIDDGSDNVYLVNLRALYAGAFQSALFPVAVTVTNKDEPGVVRVSPSSQPRVGTRLQATLTDPDGSVSDTQWRWQQRAGGSTSWDALTSPESGFSAYKPVAADTGQYLRATVIYTDGHGPDRSPPRARASGR